jgi:hypothetical protein
VQDAGRGDLFITRALRHFDDVAVCAANRGYRDAVPAIMLLAAVLAAEEVSFVLVGSAGLYLHGERIRVRDVDAVLCPDRVNLERLHMVLADLVIGGPAPPLRSLATADLVSVHTSYGKLDCLLERGRRDWDMLRGGVRPFSVRGVPVTVADAGEIRSLRARFKDCTRTSRYFAPVGT